MYLKGVEIFGFKSFGERVNIDFNKGITSIVGPNGSGKSNILDGILWVLGEQSYKNIRAKESKDIIFSGGEGKKASNYAEVSLHIDNYDNFFPIDHKNIKITRKMYVTGENEYLINDRKVRLRDVSDLFLDTGVGKSAYSVIGQGKVERIISSSNKEIKGIIEEAAGVKKFQLKKIEAVKKLDIVKNELEKIELILNEVGENRKRIEKQAEKASEYLNLKSEKESLEKGIYTYELNLYESELKEKSVESINISKELEELEKKYEETQKIFSLNEAREKEVKEQIAIYINKNSELKKQIENLERENIVLEERKKSFERELKEKEEAQVKIKNRLQEKFEKIENSRTEKNNLNLKIDEIEKTHREYEKKLSIIESEKKDKEISIELKKRKIMDLEVENLKLLNEIESSTRRVKGSSSKLQNLEIELKKTREQKEQNDLELKKSLNDRENKNVELKRTEDRQIELETQITTLSRGINKYSEALRNLEFDEKKIQIKLQTLHRIEESNEGFYRGVKEVLNSKIPGVEGAFISLINVPETMEKAIEASISGNLQDIVVKTDRVAKECIEILKIKKVGRASFLPLDTIKVGNLREIPKMTGVVGRASELIKYDLRYKSIVDMLLGNILVVENIDTALSILKQNKFSGNIVTLSGELLSGRGRITGGENNSSTVSQIFERKKEIKLLEETLLKTRENITSANQELQEMNRKLEAVEEEIGQIDSLEENIRREFKKYEEIYNQILEKSGRISKELRIIELEYAEEQNYVKEYAKRLDYSKEEKVNLEKIILEMKDILDREILEIESKNREIEKLKNESSDIRILYLNSKDKLQKIDEDLEKLNFEKLEIQKEIETNQERLEKIKKELENIAHTADNIEVKIEGLNSNYQFEIVEMQGLKKEIEELEEKQKQLMKLEKDLENSLFKEKDLHNRQTQRLEKLNSDIQEIRNKLEELKSVQENSLSNEELEISKKRTVELEVRLKAFQNVNLMAIEEFKELDEKYKFMTSQKDDLANGKEALVELLDDIDTTIEKRFYEAYEEIDKNFNEMCIETLDNSEGKLSLINGENFENCGVEISVKFKNKKRQSLSLLSGGEKSMVAIAFIMSIFMYKPSPFTFLDEIEAALDEKNTRKLINKLKEFTTKSQFILITHNKETMKSSDTLFGVTMNKKIGISKLVPVKL